MILYLIKAPKRANMDKIKMATSTFAPYNHSCTFALQRPRDDLEELFLILYAHIFTASLTLLI